MAMKLKKIRENANLSITEICLELGISEGTLEALESGKNLSVHYKDYLTLLKNKGINLNKLFV